MKKKLFLVILLILLISYPPLYLIAMHGVKALFGFFAEDTFYYLSVARNSIGGFVTTFDGERVTNGYHPFWQLLLIGLFKVVGREQATQLYSTFFMSYALTLGGLLFAGLAIHKCTRSVIAPLWMLPGAFSLLFEVKRVTQGITYSYSAWSTMNGMESSLSIFFGGILMFLLTPSRASLAADGQEPDAAGAGETRSNLHYLALGCILACCVFSRLDDIFLLPAFGLCILLGLAGRERRITRIFLIGLPTTIVLAVYMAVNYKYVGTPMPISGQMKGGVFFKNNLMTLLGDLLPPLRSARYYNPALWEGTANRNMAMAIPVLLAISILALLWMRAKRAGKSGAAFAATMSLTPLLIYIIFKGFYNFTAVSLPYQGYWYWALSIMTINVALVVLGAEMVGNYVRDEGRALLAALGVIVWFFVYCHYSASVIYKVGNHTHWSYAFWQARGEIRKSLTAYDPKVKLIDGFDGIVGYALELPTISGTGLATDLEGLKAAKKQRYLDYCLERGFNVLGHSTRPGGYVNITSNDLIKKDVFTLPAAYVTFTQVTKSGR